MRNLVAVAFVLAFDLSAQSTVSVIGKGRGLDHVTVGLSDKSAAEEIYARKLGFSVVTKNRFPDSGLEQATIALPPGYIELLWRYQVTPETAAADPVTAKIQGGGGPAMYNIHVSPIEQAFEAMKTLGMKVALREARTIRTPDGKERPGAWQSISIDAQQRATAVPGVPGGRAVSFLEYRDSEGRQESIALHENTARKLRSVWVAVADLSIATRQAERFGFRLIGKRNYDSLGESGVEIECGQGSIVLFQPANSASTLSSIVKRQGMGLFGMSVGVSNLGTAQRIAEDGFATKFKMSVSGKSTAFVVPGALTGGSVIEFVQE